MISPYSSGKSITAVTALCDFDNKARKGVLSCLKDLGIETMDMVIPFHKIEIYVGMIVSGIGKSRTTHELSKVCYCYGCSDVAGIPIVFLGKSENVPTVLETRDDTFLVEDLDRLSSVLKQMRTLFSLHAELFSKLPLEDRVKLRRKVMEETINKMKELGYIEKAIQKL